MRPTIPARPEQTHPLVYIDIINRALREAALAATANDALDCCADALLHVAELARADEFTLRHLLTDRLKTEHSLRGPSAEDSSRGVA